AARPRVRSRAVVADQRERTRLMLDSLSLTAWFASSIESIPHRHGARNRTGSPLLARPAGVLPEVAVNGDWWQTLSNLGAGATPAAGRPVHPKKQSGPPLSGRAADRQVTAVASSVRRHAIGGEQGRI